MSSLSKMLLLFTGIIFLSGLSIYTFGTLGKSSTTEKVSETSASLPERPKTTTSSAKTTETTSAKKVIVDSPPPVVPKSWHEVETFSGSGNQHTPTFTIKGQQWRITWKAVAESDYCKSSSCALDLFIKNSDDSDFSIVSTTAVKGVKEGTSYQYASGTFYFAIVGATLDGWNVSVEDYY